LTQALIRKKNFQNAACIDEIAKVDFLRRCTIHVRDTLLTDAVVAQQDRVWDGLCAPLAPEILDELSGIRQENERRREAAKYNTGSITERQMQQLRAICERVKPETVVEVGTFIGNSTRAFKADHVYTCDASNDCFPASDRIETFALRESTQMFEQLVERHVRADLFFLDGRLRSTDMPLVQRLMHDKTVFVFDDYRDNMKGVANARIVASSLNSKKWALIEPDRRFDDSTLAVIAPREMIEQWVAA
jgi:predicted O-methyltransferase YrrM